MLLFKADGLNLEIHSHRAAVSELEGDLRANVCSPLQVLQGLGVGEELPEELPGELGGHIQGAGGLALEEVEVGQEVVGAPSTLKARQEKHGAQSSASL